MHIITILCYQTKFIDTQNCFFIYILETLLFISLKKWIAFFFRLRMTILQTLDLIGDRKRAFCNFYGQNICHPCMHIYWIHTYKVNEHRRETICSVNFSATAGPQSKPGTTELHRRHQHNDEHIFILVHFKSRFTNNSST